MVYPAQERIVAMRVTGKSTPSSSNKTHTTSKRVQHTHVGPRLELVKQQLELLVVGVLQHVARVRHVRLLALPGASVFDLSVSVRPGPSEVAGGRGKTKTKNRGGARGPGLQTWKSTLPALGQVLG